jgi:tryptophan halogenase
MPKINKIVIVGGGTAGWIASAAFAKYFPKSKIIGIESPRIPTLGVGESTAPMVRHFLNACLDIPNKEFMQGTDATYKTSVQFNDFNYVGDGGFHYPMGAPEFKNNEDGYMDWKMVKRAYPKTPNQDFVRSHHPIAALFEQNKIDENLDGAFGKFKMHTDAAYHFDASKVGPWIRDNYCVPNGVKVIYGEVTDVVVNENSIEYLLVQEGSKQTKVDADLYIDCSGRQSILLGQAMEEEWITLQDQLPNDSAIATQIFYKDKEQEMIPYTKSTALQNGWAWYVPIYSRSGNGYVYSSKYITRDQALEEFKEYLMSDKMPIAMTREEVDNLNYKDIEWDAGFYKNSWKKNVIAFGTAAGFVEALEGTGVYFVTNLLRMAINLLQREHYNQFTIDSFNRYSREQFHGWANFISTFYQLSQREDSQYWKDLSNKSIDVVPGYEDAGADGIKTYYYDANVSDNLEESLFRRNHGYMYVTTGMGFMPDASPVNVDLIKLWKNDLKNEYFYRQSDKNRIYFMGKKQEWKKTAERSPYMYNYLKDNIHGA